MTSYNDFAVMLPSECADKFKKIQNYMIYSIYAIIAKNFIGTYGLFIPRNALLEYLELTIT